MKRKRSLPFAELSRDSGVTGSTTTHSSQERSGITYQVNSSRSDNRSFEVRVDILP